jgi:transposase
MSRNRKRHSAEFKAKVALEAAKDIKTLSELSSQYGVHAAQISQWKKRLLASMSELFNKHTQSKDQSEKIDELYRQIGQVTVERDWLKKKLQIFP